MATDIIFVDGLSVTAGSEKAPWVKGRFGINKKFIEFFNANVDERGWLNFQLLESKKGVLYCALDTYKKDQAKTTAPVRKAVEVIEYPEESGDLSSIPF